MSKSSENTNGVRRHVRSIAEKIEQIEDDDVDGWGGIANVLEQAHQHAKAHHGNVRTETIVNSDFKKTGRTDSGRI